MKSRTKTIKNALYILTVCALSQGCTQEADDFTESGFTTVVASGGSAQISGTTLSNSTSSANINNDGDGYAYEVGVDDGNGFVARSGVISSTSVAALPTSGSASMSGQYSAARVTSISLAGTQLTGVANNGSGSITLLADFEKHTLKGTSDNSLLVVRGNFTGKALNGSVVYRGIPGTLTGLVGGDQAVGAFHGKTDSSIMAGGFLVDE